MLLDKIKGLKKATGSDSEWYRISPELQDEYPIKLENVHYYYRIYQKVVVVDAVESHPSPGLPPTCEDPPAAANPTPVCENPEAETLNVAAETLNVAAETLNVAAETLNPEAETLNVTAEQAVVADHAEEEV